MKRVLKIITWIMTLLVFIIAVGLLTVSITAKVKNTVPTVFGYSLHIVVTDSMTPTIQPKDLVLSKKADIDQVNVGDTIIFRSPDPTLKGIIILHNVDEVVEIDGQKAVLTKGTKEGIGQDKFPVTQIMGRYVSHSTVLGKIVAFLMKPVNLVFILVAIVLINVIIVCIKRVMKAAKEERRKDEQS